MNQIEAIAKCDTLLKQHGLMDWSTLTFTKNLLGQCGIHEKIIWLNASYCDNAPEAEVLDTILHEIAHALAWIQHHTHEHDYLWKGICRRIGARPERIGKWTLPRKWQIYCGGCKKIIGTRIKRIDLDNRHCAQCGSKAIEFWPVD